MISLCRPPIQSRAKNSAANKGHLENSQSHGLVTRRPRPAEATSASPNAASRPVEDEQPSFTTLPAYQLLPPYGIPGRTEDVEKTTALLCTASVSIAATRPAAPSSRCRQIPGAAGCLFLVPWFDSKVLGRRVFPRGPWNRVCWVLVL